MNDALPSSDSRSAQPRADRLRSVVDWWRSQPLEAILVGLGLFALLATFVAADPTSKVTFSSSPFTDEAFNTVNARNFVQLGRWSTDEWNLYLVNLPFSLLQAAWFGLVGVGIVQARLIAIACVSLTAAALIWDLRGSRSLPAVSSSCTADWRSSRTWSCSASCSGRRSSPVTTD
jgi:hypothetical protein